MDKGKLFLPIAILVASIILGGFYYMSQLDKRKSIERQSQLELRAMNDREKEADYRQQENKRQLEICISEAEHKRFEAVRMWTVDFYNKNCENAPTIDAGILCRKGVIEQVDKAKAEEQSEKKDCYARYK